MSERTKDDPASRAEPERRDSPAAHDLGPEPLVDGVLAALRAGPEAGATALWGALTPRARAALGEVADLRRALANELLAPLVAHTQAATADWERRGDAARTQVTVEGAAGGRGVYLVSCRRGGDGAWRLSGLRRDDLPWS